ncbi:MAG: RDD family protein [Myxococcaceae bacterium]
MAARTTTKTVSLLNGTHSVLTPEYVQFNFVLAGLYSRFFAWLIDVLITSAITVGILFGVILMSIAAPGFASALSFILWFLVQWGYAVFFESIWSGQTPGKRALGLRVIQENGVRIGFWNAVLRTLGRPVDSLPVLYLVGGTVALFNKSHQRLGDMLAGTIVVRERKLAVPASLSRPDEELHLLEDALFQSRVAKLSEEEQEVIFQAALRREELGMEARLKLFSALSLRLQEERDVFKPPHLSDEKLVLLVAAVLVAQKKKVSKAPARRAA